MPASPSETKVFEQERAQFTYRWKAAVSRGFAEFGRFCSGSLSRGILQSGPRNLAKFSSENCRRYHQSLRVCTLNFYVPMQSQTTSCCGKSHKYLCKTANVRLFFTDYFLSYFCFAACGPSGAQGPRFLRHCLQNR